MAYVKTDWKRVPTYTSEKTIIETVQYIGSYFRLPLTVKFDDWASTASIDLKQSCITLPRWLTKASHPKIVFFIAHECAHVKVFPKTIHEHVFYEAWARQLGIRDAGRFMNMLADQLVNDYCMQDPPFKEQFADGCGDFYRRYNRRSRSDTERWHSGNSYRRVQEVTGKRRRPFRNRTEESLFKLVHHDDRPLEKRFPEIADLARAWFDSTSQMHAVATALPPIEDPGEFDEWLKRIHRISKEAVLESLKHAASRRVLMDYVQLAAFDEWVIAQSNAEKRAKKKTGRGEGLDTWDSGDRISDLDIRKTIETYGAVIPSVTTLKRTAGPEDEEKSWGTGLQAYIIDQSGSMIDSIDLVSLICFAAIKHAEKRGDEVAILSFSDPEKPVFHLKPTRNYSAARPILEEIQAEGSTHLAPALRWLVEYCQPNRKKPTAIIFTDTMIADVNESLVQLKRVGELGGTTILVSTSPACDWVKQASLGMRMQHFVVDYGKLDNIQEILKYVTQ